MNIAKRNVKIQTFMENPNIDLEMLLENILKKEEYITIKYHNTPSDNVSGFYEINIPYCRGGSLEEWLI